MNPDDWLYWGRWIQPTLSGSYWDDWANKNTFPFDLKGVSGELPVIDGHFFLKKSDLDAIGTFLKEHEGDDELLATMERWVHDAHALCRKEIERKPSDTKHALVSLRTLYNAVGNPWCFFGFFVDRWLEQRVPELIDEPQAFVAAITPKHPPIVVQQTREARRLRSSLGTATHIRELSATQRNQVVSHVERFRFCGIHHFVGEPYTTQKFFSESLQEPREQDPPHVPASVRWHHELACIAAWARTFMAETSGMLAHAFRPDLQAAEYALGLGWSDILWLHIDEIIAGMEEPHAFAKPDLEARKQKYGLYSRDDEIIVVSGDDVDALLRWIHPPQSASLPLKGRPASRGKSTGTACVVLRPEDMHKMKKGNVMVTNETAPDFMPAMRLACAIVTDVGGLTSHAAIVSRELGIPCVTDTKHATQILHDGDTITVDADNGIVSR